MDEKTILLKGGNIVSEIGVIPGGYLLIKGQKISSLGEAGVAVTADETIDVSGKTVVPGFIDMHTHGMMDVDFMESDVPATMRGFEYYAAFGVTRLVASTLSNPMETIISQAKRIRQAGEESVIGDILHGVHVEGPWLAPRCRGGHALEYLKKPEKMDVERLLGEAGDIVKTVTYAPELDNSVWLTEQLADYGIVPVLGHTEASYEDAEKVIRAGARHVTHMYDTTMGYKENPDEALVMLPGMETAVLYHNQVSIELIGCPVHVPKPFFKFIDKVKPWDKKVIVTDCLVGTGRPDGTVLTYKDGRKVYVEEGVLRMIDDDPAVNGNLTGSAVTINRAFKRLCEYAELPIHEAVRWVSYNPAATLGIQNETGSLRAGKFADIVIMDDQFNVEMTLLKGKTIFQGGVL